MDCLRNRRTDAITSKSWLDPVLMDEAKIIVEVKLYKPFPQKVALEDTSGSITMVDVVYSWLLQLVANWVIKQLDV